MNAKIAEMMHSIEQPFSVGVIYGGQEIHASHRWWKLAQLRHILTDMENYIRCKVQMQMIYRRLKEKMLGLNGKGDFLHDIMTL